MRRISLLPVLCLTSAAAHAGTWSDLWLTQDQQAQRLLDSNHPAAAAPLFSDARRQAYAQLQAGQYAKAADLLAPLKDTDSLYNRGNALAHTGQLREALKAYDAALAAAPRNQDVIHNRDLVKRALEQQNRTAQQRNGGSRSGGDQGQQGPNGRDGSSGDQGRQSAADRNASRPSPTDGASQSPTQTRAGAQNNQQAHAGAQSQANTQPGSKVGSSPQTGGEAHSGKQAQSGSQAQAGAHPGDPSQGNAQSPPANLAPNQPGGTGSQQASGQAANPSQDLGSSTAASPTQQPGGQTGNNALAQQPGASHSENGSQSAGGQASGPDSDAARKDAAAGIRYQQSQARAAAAKGAATPNRPGGTVDSHSGTRVEGNPPQPPSEQTLALDQWLRGIPEDSGELLRRKFLIEHMMRQQGDAQ